MSVFCGFPAGSARQTAAVILLCAGCAHGASDAARFTGWREHVAAAGELERAGRLNPAQSELDLALSQARASGDSAAVAHVLEGMGAFDDRIGHFVEAESRFEDCLGIWRQRLGSGHPALVRVINQLAALYLETGQPGKAERLDLAHWRERLEATSPASEDLPALLENLATMASLRGRFEEADSLFQENLELMQRRGQSGTTEHAVTLNNLGLSCLRAKRFDRAIEHLSMSESIWEKLRGPEAVNVGLTSYNLAVAYEAAGRLADAEPPMRRALRIAEQSLGPASLRTAEVLRGYSQLLRKQRRKAEAKEMEARAGGIFREQSGQEPARYEVDAAGLSFGR